MTLPDHDELHWLAFRYVADELPAEQRGAFEQRLAEDQTAREAVAEAVGITAAIYGSVAAGQQPQRQLDQLRWRRRTSRIAICLLSTAAAALFLMLAVQFRASDPGITDSFGRPEDQTVDSGQAHEYGQLAVAWSQSLASIASTTPDGDALVSEDEFTDTAEISGIWSDPAEAPDAPDWMYAAVSGLRGQRSQPPVTPLDDPPTTQQEQGI